MILIKHIKNNIFLLKLKNLILILKYVLHTTNKNWWYTWHFIHNYEHNLGYYIHFFSLQYVA